ncbi:hypothetical protein [Halomonas salipaludis]|nr:hypothetical protein [Halomonas salipaludis]
MPHQHPGDDTSTIAKPAVKGFIGLFATATASDMAQRLYSMHRSGR